VEQAFQGLLLSPRIEIGFSPEALPFIDGDKNFKGRTKPVRMGAQRFDDSLSR
jgi:hypothetical protein